MATVNFSVPEDVKEAFQRILARRHYAPSVTEAQLRDAREEGRP